ncbi:MAG: hypothetical protein ACOX41_04170 [Anaerovoracaceae bacterium]|jgi:hypothetical protein
MAAQITDDFIYEDKEYAIAASTGSLGFRPRDAGLHPVPLQHNVRRGYWCLYTVNGERLQLRDLFVHDSGGEYPPINGREAAPPPQLRDDPAMFFRQMGYHHYADLQLDLPYSGSILLGADFLHSYYHFRRPAAAWGYQTLLELTFADGRLTLAEDRSETAAALRERVDRARSENGLTPEDCLGNPTVDQRAVQEAGLDLWWL